MPNTTEVLLPAVQCGPVLDGSSDVMAYHRPGESLMAVIVFPGNATLEQEIPATVVLASTAPETGVDAVPPSRSRRVHVSPASPPPNSSVTVTSRSTRKYHPRSTYVPPWELPDRATRYSPVALIVSTESDVVVNDAVAGFPVPAAFVAVTAMA